MNLPEGYRVYTIPHFVYLYCEDEKIGVFSKTGASEETIEAEAWEHYDKKTRGRALMAEEIEAERRKNEK